MTYFRVITDDSVEDFETLAEAKAYIFNECAPDEYWSIRGYESKDAFEEWQKPFYNVSLYDIAKKFLLEVD